MATMYENVCDISLTVHRRTVLKIVISNTTSGYEIAGNFQSQIRVFVSALLS
jgi:hypothetical protein